MTLYADRKHYSFPDNKYNVWRYGAGSLMGLMANYKFTEYGMDTINTWADKIGDEELTQARRIVLQQEFRGIMQVLVSGGHAIQEQNDEVRQTAKWYETVTYPT